METGEVESPRYKGNIFFHGDSDLVRLVFNEVFGSEQYLEGLEYIKTLEKPIVVDCGAHIGMSVLYFNTAPNATIYALEPEKKNFDDLCANVRGKDNITPLNIGLRSFSGESDFYLGEKGSAGGSFLEQAGEKTSYKHLNMEDFMNENNIDHIDLLKIDVEGVEYEILLSEAFQRVEDKIDMIVGESHIYPMYPYAIPTILKNYDVEFLPDPNLVINIHGQLKGDKNPFKLDVNVNSLFVARRKK
jgi:FkbM family methyltransferase